MVSETKQWKTKTEVTLLNFVPEVWIYNYMKMGVMIKIRGEEGYFSILKVVLNCLKKINAVWAHLKENIYFIKLPVQYD